MNLPDVNVLFARVCARHAHHLIADRWYRDSREKNERWALCRITHLALLRLLTNPIAMASEALSAKAAWDVLDLLEADPLCRFQEEPASCWTEFKRMTTVAGFTHSGWTDAYLAAIAAASGSRIVTFDRRFRDWPQIRCLILAPQ